MIVTWPPPNTNTSLRLMTAGQSWIRDGICRTGDHCSTVSLECRMASATRKLFQLQAQCRSRPSSTHMVRLMASCCYKHAGARECFVRVRRRVQDMAALMRSHSLGGRGAVRNSHRKRSDAPVRNVQAHAWQQRTRGAAGTRITRRGHELFFTEEFIPWPFF